MPCPLCQREHPYTKSQALAVFSKTPRKLERTFTGLAPGRAAARPAPDKWSPKEIICHLSDCEVVYGFRIRKILGETTPVLASFDSEAWARGLHYREQQLKSALAGFIALRTVHVGLLKSLPAKAWKRTGEHAEYGPLTLLQLTAHLADHDLNHMAQIERLCVRKKVGK